MKRSPSLRLLVMALPFSLVACDTPDRPAPTATAAAPAKPQTVESFYTSPEDCAKAGEDAVACRKAFEEAQKAALATAPRFTSANACEAEFGGCIEVAAPPAAPAGTASAGTPAPAQAGGGGSFFMPMMLGYMMGSSSSSGLNSGSSGFAPVYRNRDGGYTRAFRDNAGGSTYRSTPVTAKPNAKAVPPPRATPPKVAPTRTATPTRAGFGSRAGGSRGGGG